MILDRRSPERAALTRRAAERTPQWKRINWWADSAEDRFGGLLVSASESGLAILVDPEDAPSIGQTIRIRRGSRAWSRAARVVRVNPITATSVHVGAEFAEIQHA